MKKIKVMIVLCCSGLIAYAGDTNFVNAFNTIWQTHHASNILVFVEQNVNTNKSPEVLSARGIVAAILQDWIPGATNYWEEAIQMIETNGTYSARGKTNSINQIRALQGIVSGTSTNPPTWNTNIHVVIFTETGDEAPFLFVLEKIATLPPAENP